MSIVRRMEHTETTTSDVPVRPVVIANCGELKDGEDDGFRDPHADPLDPTPDYPADAGTCHSSFYSTCSLGPSAQKLSSLSVTEHPTALPKNVDISY